MEKGREAWRYGLADVSARRIEQHCGNGEIAMRVDPTYIKNLVGSLDQTQASEQQLSSELSSGVSIASLSQNPLGAGENVLLLNQIQQDDSFTESSNMVTGQLQVADSALGSVVSDLTQAISL